MEGLTVFQAIVLMVSGILLFVCGFVTAKVVPGEARKPKNRVKVQTRSSLGFDVTNPINSNYMKG